MKNSKEIEVIESDIVFATHCFNLVWTADDDETEKLFIEYMAQSFAKYRVYLKAKFSSASAMTPQDFAEWVKERQNYESRKANIQG